MITMSGLLLSIFYFMSIFLFVNSNSLMLYWVMMEVNMVVFILVICKESKSTVNQSLFYFFIQSLGSMMFLMSMASFKVMGHLIPTVMLAFAVMLKMGLIPFHQWLIKIYSQMEGKSLLLLITLQKVPFFVILSNMEMEMNLLIVILNSIMGAFLVFKSTSMKEMLVTSSIYMTGWIWMTSKLSMEMFFVFYFAYFFMNWIFLSIFSGKVDSTSKGWSTETVLVMMFFLGLPPMSLFFMKMYVMGHIYGNASMTILLIFWASSFFATMGYLKFFVGLISYSEKSSKLLKDKALKKKMIFGMTMIGSLTLLM